MWRQTPHTIGPCRATSSANAPSSSRIRTRRSASDRESPTARRTIECRRCSIGGLVVGFEEIVAAERTVLRRIVVARRERPHVSGPPIRNGSWGYHYSEFAATSIHDFDESRETSVR